MSTGHGRRRGKKHEEHEEHENHERWLVSGFDMMTLLFVLFVVLFAMSKVDEQKFAALAKGMADAFGGPIAVQPGPTPEGSVLDGLPGAVDIASAIAPTLRDVPNDLGVEGHANHLPVTPGGPWPSNWELSAYRATTVVRYLTGDGVPGTRMVANGYSDTRPLVPPSDPSSITVNRRVDVVVLSDASAEANALLPGIDKNRTMEGLEK